MRKTLISWLISTIIVSAIWVPLTSQATIEKTASVAVPFVANTGQHDVSVAFSAQTFGGTVFVLKDGAIVYDLPVQSDESGGRVLKERLSGASVGPVTGLDRSSTSVSSFIGSDVSNWRRDIPSYSAVDLGEVYAGIRMHLRAYGNNIEKVFVSSPGSDPDQIAVSVQGCDVLSVNDSGELEASTALGSVSFTAPVAYQESGGERRYVDVAYTVDGRTYGFCIGDYDPALPLVIDPLLSSTYLGGSNTDDSYEPSIAVDSEGFVFFSGYTSSTNFPTTTGVYNEDYSGGTRDRFVAKFNHDLSSLVACTYIGGSGEEVGMGLAIDSLGNVYVAGYTYSTNFPTTSGAYDEGHNGGRDAYVAKLDNNLTTLISSTYLGGSNNEGQTWPRIDLTLSGDGSVYVAGLTKSTNFPTPGGWDNTLAGGLNGGDVFVARFDADLTTLEAATYLGESADEWRVSVVVDGADNVFVCGETESYYFPKTSGAFDESFNGTSDVFVSRLTSDLSLLTASTVLGHSAAEEALAMRVDEGGQVYICGYTRSPAFPTTSGAFDQSWGGGDRDAYVAKFDNNLTTLLACTLLGGSDRDDCRDLAITGSGAIVLTGNTRSSNFPMVDAYDETINGGSDGFIAILDSNLASLSHSTYFGGSADDVGFCIALNESDDLLIGGYTNSSTNFPTTPGAYDSTYGGGGNDCFVALYSPHRFTRTTGAAGVDDIGWSWSANWIDYDNDGFVDLFATNFDTDNVLYHNNGDGTFTSQAAGDIASCNTDGIMSAGASWGDFDNDGLLDAFIATFREGNPPVNRAFRNEGGGVFASVSASEMVGDAGNSIEPAWADYNSDGLLDLYVANHSGPNYLYRQDDTGFVRVTTGPIGTDDAGSNGAAWADYDNDGDLDILVANAWGDQLDYLYENTGSGEFARVMTGDVSTVATDSWSPSWGDYDNDGDQDLFVTHTVWGQPLTSMDALHRNNGDGTLSLQSSLEPCMHSSSSFSSAWGDVDNDGDLDLFVAVGGNNLFYENSGDGSFALVTDGALVTDSIESLGCAWADYDRDGDLDLFVTNGAGQTNDLFRNNGNSNNWIIIKCEGVRSNRAAIGAKVRLKATIGGQPTWQLREVSSKTGKNSQNSLNAHMGLGDATVIDSIVVEWPSGIIQTMTDVEINQFLTIEEEFCCGTFSGGYTGNTNCSEDGKLTLSDITILIDNVYISKDALCCAANGNTNADAECKNTLSDITKLIDAVYISKVLPGECMGECEQQI